MIVVKLDETDFQKLSFFKDYLTVLLARKVNITKIPFDVIYDHIIKHLDWYSCINFVYTIRDHFSYSEIRELTEYNFFIGEFYNTIQKLGDEIYYQTRPYKFVAYIFSQWSPFSKNSQLPLASVSLSDVYPHVNIQYNDYGIQMHALTQVQKKLLTARLSAHMHSQLLLPGWFRYKRRYNFQKLPIATATCDAHNFSMFLDGKMQYLRDVLKVNKL